MIVFEHAIVSIVHASLGQRLFVGLCVVRLFMRDCVCAHASFFLCMLHRCMVHASLIPRHLRFCRYQWGERFTISTRMRVGFWTYVLLLVGVIIINIAGEWRRVGLGNVFKLLVRISG